MNNGRHNARHAYYVSFKRQRTLITIVYEGDFACINEYKGMLSGVSWYRSNYDLAPPFEYWVIDSAWVFEPNIGGKQLGELLQMKLEKDANILPITPQQFDLMVYAYEREHEFAADA